MSAFGYSYLLDMFGTRDGVADDLDLTYRFLESLVDRIGMTPMGQPVVIHGPRRNGVELFPEKAGVSGWQPLIESGIQIHSIEPTHFITLDLYSCNCFDKSIVKSFAYETFGFTRSQEHWIERGSDYPLGGIH
jgi:S-adenosylmethionine decarboxylase